MNINKNGGLEVINDEFFRVTNSIINLQNFLKI